MNIIVQTIGLVNGLTYVDKIINNKGYIVNNKVYPTLKSITPEYGSIKRVEGWPYKMIEVAAFII